MTRRLDEPNNEYIDAQLDVARQALGQATGRLPIGMGFICWLLEAAGPDAEKFIRRVAPQVEVIWLSFGRDMRRWYKAVRAADDETKVRYSPQRSHACLRSLSV